MKKESRCGIKDIITEIAVQIGSLLRQIHLIIDLSLHYMAGIETDQ